MMHMPLARRYRPQRFAEVMGQDEAVSALKNALMRKKTAHAYLFCGTRGCGKTTLARLLAKAVNCLQSDRSAEPCNQCSSCVAMDQGSHLDVIEIDGASHRGIDDIRQIKEAVGFQPSLGRFKVYIIDEVHMLTKEAFNALLKTLEEPPANVKFILATTEPHRVPPTILSRCQRFQLRRIPTQAIEKLLEQVLDREQIPFERAALLELAFRADGSFRDSLSLLDQLLAFEPQRVTYTGLATLLGLAPVELIERYETAIERSSSALMLQLVDSLLAQGIEPSYFLEQLQLHYRNLLSVVCRSGVEELTERARLLYDQLAARYREGDLLFILDLLQEALQRAKSVNQPRLHLEVILLHLARKPWLFCLDRLLERLEQLEKQLSPSMATDQAMKEQKTRTSLPSSPSQAEKPQSAPAPFPSLPQPTDRNSPQNPLSCHHPSKDAPALEQVKSLSPATPPHRLAQPAAQPPASSPAKPTPSTPSQDPSNSGPHSLNNPTSTSAKRLPPGRYEGVIQFAAKELGGHLR